jgi:protein TonB
MDGKMLAFVASLTVHATLLVATVTPQAGPAPGVQSALPAETDITVDLRADPLPPDVASDGAPTFPDVQRVAIPPSRAATPAPRPAAAVQAPHVAAAPDAVPGASPPLDDAPRFTIAIGADAALPAAVAPSFAAALGGGAAPRGSDDAPLSEDGVSAPARLSRGDAPRYPESARRQGVEADVPLEIVVSSAGVVEEARALSRPGYGLDEAAIAAVKRYRFRPAVRDGSAVRVRMRWVMQFRLW